MHELPIYHGCGHSRAVVAVAVVDAEDWPSVKDYEWRLLAVQGLRYAYRRWIRDGKRVKILLHNDILGIRGVDHRDGDGLNNRRENLRPATHAQNMQNRRKHRNGVTSPARGVWWMARAKKWRARVRLDRRTVFQRDFCEHMDAVEAARVARLTYLPFTNEARAS